MLYLVLIAVVGLTQANTLPPPLTGTLAPPMMTSMAPHNVGTRSTHKHHHSTVNHHTTVKHHGHHHTTVKHHGHHHTTPPPTVDSNEFDTATFYYDSLSHTMVMHLGACYLMKLNTTQQHMVHTQRGLKSIEYTLMKYAVQGHRTHMTHDQVVAMSVHLSHMCPGQNNFLVHHVTHHQHSTVPTTTGW